MSTGVADRGRIPASRRGYGVVELLVEVVGVAEAESVVVAPVVTHLSPGHPRPRVRGGERHNTVVFLWGEVLVAKSFSLLGEVFL